MLGEALTGGIEYLGLGLLFGLGFLEDPVSIWTTCLKEEASVWKKVVRSDMEVTCRVGLLMLLGEGSELCALSLYLGELFIEARIEKEVSCFTLIHWLKGYVCVIL